MSGDKKITIEDVTVCIRERIDMTSDADTACQIVEAFVAEKDARIAELEAIIKAAPHGYGCASQKGVLTISGCDCWKSKAGEKAQ